MNTNVAKSQGIGRWGRPLLGASALALAMSFVAAPAVASSHREAPFITQLPKVDGTDFYMFRSTEPGRSAFVTVIANYAPLHGAAVAMRGRLPVDGRRDGEVASRAAIEIAVVVLESGPDAQCAEDRVIELLGRLKIINAEHHVTEHGCLHPGTFFKVKPDVVNVKPNVAPSQASPGW